jgi:hypothetical protein
MTVKKTTTGHPDSLPLSHHPAWHRSTRAQTIPFMQNKANFQEAKKDVTASPISPYNNLTPQTRQKNKANSNPIYQHPAHCPRLLPTQQTPARANNTFCAKQSQFPEAYNACNRSSNKHLRRKTTPGGAKKQSQFKPNLNPSLSSLSQRMSVYNPTIVQRCGFHP